MLHFSCEVEEINNKNNATPSDSKKVIPENLKANEQDIIRKNQPIYFINKKSNTESIIAIVLISLILFLLIFLLGYLIYTIIKEDKKKNQEQDIIEMRKLPTYLSTKDIERLLITKSPDNLNELLWMVENGLVKDTLKGILQFLIENNSEITINSFLTTKIKENLDLSFDYGKMKIKNTLFSNDDEKNNLIKTIKDILKNIKKNQNDCDYNKIKKQFFFEILLSLIEGEFDFYKQNENYELKRVVLDGFLNKNYKMFFEISQKNYFLLF
jgi:hypothetical protein